ncbi:cytochrome P450 [Bimuria novae-zelandiae CBS 107.79]|uniref:Cytochrome P450 n=1 Tax=Bimuria novae-zelandiae CBS 107.79 TaxID=1447943 RepID=A0A6A5UV95_9PLEO|nr:cytochrome P450 [Bimuria novae-zelandiae CBS 107.79]
MLSLWATLVTVLALYQIAKIIYRIFLHPLAKFPGPKIAAATRWYEAYYDLRPHRPGTFFLELKRLHKIYGHIVRINPEELHVDDPEWIDVLYVTPARGIRDKYTPAALMAGAPGSGFGTSLHDVHRKRRASISPLFSKAAAASSTDLIYKNVLTMLQNVRKQIKHQGYAEIQVNWLTMNCDSLTDSFLGKGMGLLRDEKLAQAWAETVNAVATGTPFSKQFPWFIPLASKLPIWVLERLTPELSKLLKVRKDMLEQATEAVAFHSQHVGVSKGARPTHELYRTILSFSGLSEQEKRPERISQEGFVVLVAGSDTTARILTNGVFFVLSDKTKITPRLYDELLQAMPTLDSRPSLQKLEKLPWLTAVIKETMRLSALQTSRLSVVSPRDDLHYQEWAIPAGSAVGMTLRDILLDPEIFEDPEAFRPERWLSDNPSLDRINRYFLPFGRGSRMCLGLNTAWVTLYIGFAVFFRHTDFVLHDTLYERDVKVVRDCFTGKASDHSKGVRIKHVSADPM